MTEHTEDALKVLRDELAGVSPSPEFQSRVRQRIAGELDLLRDQLAAVEPSPEFKVRVRQGIDAAREQRSASWLSGWRWVVPASAVAAVVLLAVVLSQRGAVTPAPVAVTVQSDLPSAGAAGRGTPDSGRGTPDSGPRTPNPEPRTPDPGPRTPNPKRAASGSKPALEVITNQPARLRETWARLQEGAIVVGTTMSPDLIGTQDVTVALIEVQPVVVKWLVEPPEAPSALPIIRRVTATLAERSVQ